MTEGFDRFSVLLKPVGVKVGAHQRLGLFELDIEPRGDVREPALRGGKLVVAANERLGQAVRKPFLALPDIAAQDHEVLRREAAGPPEIVALDRADVGKEPDDWAVDRVVTLRPRRAIDRV